MTDRELLEQALEALEGLADTSWSEAFKQRKYDSDEPQENCQRECVLGAITALRERLAQQEQEPVAHSVVAGALFDFMGWLTSRKKRIVLSGADDASPAAVAIHDFAEMRGLILHDPKVQDWQEKLAQPEQEPLTEKRIEELYSFWVVDLQNVVGFARAVERAASIKENT